jgi:hypothetical protein
MRPAGLMSKKFMDAQHSYFTYKHKTLGVIEALKKWDDVLLGVNTRDIRRQRIYRSVNECVARAIGEVVAVNETSGNMCRDVKSRGAGRYGSWSSVRV